MSFETGPKTGLSLFQLASARMDWLGSRQQVIASNIANADTPDYRARDVTSFEDFLTRGEVSAREVQTSWDRSPDGNQVVLEEQTLLANETESSHRLAARLYSKGHSLLALAVGRGG